MSGLIAKKTLGQNFLRSEAAVLAIVDSIKNRNLPIIEIGGGEGVVTKALLDKDFKVNVVELDPRAADLMRERFSQEILDNKLEVFEQNVLLTDFAKLVDCKDYAVVGNIPYYITGLIIRHIFEQTKLPEQATLMVQKEVADRILARDGKESILSLSVKVYGEVELVKVVKRGSFVPAPKVDSAIFTVKSIQTPFKSVEQEKVFFEIIKTAFKHPRKVALGNLKKYLIPETFTKVEEVLTDANCQNKRAEDIPLSVWLNGCGAQISYKTVSQQE